MDQDTRTEDCAPDTPIDEGMDGTLAATAVDAADGALTPIALEAVAV